MEFRDVLKDDVSCFCYIFFCSHEFEGVEEWDVVFFR